MNIVEMNLVFKYANYRKRPCISRTFLHKIEAKNQGCGLSTDTAVWSSQNSN